MFKRWFTKLKPPCQEKRRIATTIQPEWSRALTDYLQTPQPLLGEELDQQQFVALDFETTRLDPSHDQILSIGLVHFTTSEIDLASSAECYLSHGQFVKHESAQVNEITANQLKDGLPAIEALNWLLEQIKGKVVIAHCATIERDFLHALLDHAFGLNALPCHFIDTIELEKRHSYAGRTRSHASYQLNDLRQHYHLPDYNAHSAASDALACAELFMVQLSKFKLKTNTKLAEVTLT